MTMRSYDRWRRAQSSGFTIFFGGGTCKIFCPQTPPGSAKPTCQGTGAASLGGRFVIFSFVIFFICLRLRRILGRVKLHNGNNCYRPYL